MHKKNIVICILIFCIFILACESQRGGGSSGRSSRNLSRSHSSSATKKKCEFINGVKKCKKVKGDKYSFLLFLVLIPYGIY